MYRIKAEIYYNTGTGKVQEIFEVFAAFVQYSTVISVFLLTQR